MFVEKLKSGDFIGFIFKGGLVKDQEDFPGISNYKVGNGKVSFSIRNRSFEFTDFDFTSNYIQKLYEGVHNQNWLNFMYQKFGEEYKTAFLAYRKQEKIAILKSAERRFDEDTQTYIKPFKKSNSEFVEPENE